MSLSLLQPQIMCQTMFRVTFMLLVITYVLVRSSPSPRPIEYKLPFLKKCCDEATNVMQCIQAVGRNLSQGVPELDIPQYKPRYNYRKSYQHTYNKVFVGNARLRHIKVKGISNYIIEAIRFEIFPESKIQIFMSAYYPKLVLNGQCLLNGTLNDLPVNVEKGQSKMTLRNIHVDVVLNGHSYFPRKGNKKYFVLDNVQVEKIQLGSVKFSLKRHHVNVLSDLENAYLQDNSVRLWGQIIPDFLVGISTFVQTIANKVFDKYPAQQLSCGTIIPF